MFNIFLIDFYIFLYYNIFTKEIRKDNKIMTTICFFVENTDENNNLLMDVYMSFACFVEEKDCDNNYKEITIKARTEDIASIERRISAIV